jgi:16S rRNA (cytosine967-C5)-methyltransferase
MTAPSAGANVRALAAQALQRIVAGRSLRAEFAAVSPTLRDPRDRALLSALLHAGARWWLRFDAVASALLERPLPPREAALQALIVLGLVQIEVLALPGYAAVDASVEGARVLGKPKFAALVNAVLRRWLRERDARIAALDADPVTRSAHPRWLLDVFAADWPEAAAAIVAANNAEAPLWLRTNRRRVARDAFLRRLEQAGLAAHAPPQPGEAVQLEASADVTGLPGYAEGLFSVQDAAAQFAAGLLDLRDGQRVLDACAAPGGKSAQILEQADVRLLALDSDERRLPRLRENLARLGLQADVRVGDASQPAPWWDGERFDRILIDAPCSATGIIRRQPDVRLHRRAGDVPALCRTQARILDACWALLAPGGRLVYATCSVLLAENARQIAAFVARHGDARVLPVPLAGWRALTGAGVQNLPGESGMDGFFYALLEKPR